VFVTIAAYVIRRRLRESPVFQDVRDRIEEVPKVPVSDVVAHGRLPLARVFFMNVGGNSQSYIFQVFLAAYLVDTVGVDDSLIPKVLLAGALAACVAAYVAGVLGDRLGRRRVFIAIAAFLIVFTVPGLAMVSTGNTALVYLVVVVGFVFAAYGTVGVQAAWFPELFGSRYRYAGVALGREFSSVVGGGISPLVCASLVAWASGGWWPVAIYMIALMGISLVAALLTPETRDRDLLTESDA
jgi:MFS family permease